MYIPDELHALLQELKSPPRLSDMPHRIQVCQAALALVDRAQQPECWATLQCELGNSFAQNPLGERADNLEAAIAHYQQALETYTRQALPEQWADYLEAAIAHYQQALEPYARQAFPEQWAATQHALAIAYRERMQGERADNLEAAIAHLEQALEVYTRQAFPEQWAAIQNALAIAYRERMRGERADNLEAAIAHLEQALEVYTRQAFPEQWAAIQNALAIAYRERMQGERANNLEAAIAHLEQALEVYTRQAFERWEATQSTLDAETLISYMAQSLGHQAYERMRGERADNLEADIAHYQQALAERLTDGLKRLEFVSPVSPPVPDEPPPRYADCTFYEEQSPGERSRPLPQDQALRVDHWYQLEVAVRLKPIGAALSTCALSLLSCYLM
jgi:predicted LPLAT superfamily acyltransferase